MIQEQLNAKNWRRPLRAMHLLASASRRHEIVERWVDETGYNRNPVRLMPDCRPSELPLVDVVLGPTAKEVGPRVASRDRISTEARSHGANILVDKRS